MTQIILISPDGNREVWESKEKAELFTGLSYMTEQEYKFNTADIEDIKQDIYKYLQFKRQEQEYAGFEFNGQHWDSELKDELRLNSAKNLFESGITEIPNWKISKDEYVTLTPELLTQISVAMMQHASNAFDYQKNKKEEVKAIQDKQTLLEWMHNENINL